MTMNEETSRDTQKSFDGLYRLEFKDGKLSIELGEIAEEMIKKVGQNGAMLVVTEMINEHADKLYRGAVRTYEREQAFQAAGLDPEDEEY